MPDKKQKWFHLAGNTMEQSVYIPNEKEIGTFIEGEMANNPDEKYFVFNIRIEHKTQQQIDNLPDYTG